MSVQTGITALIVAACGLYVVWALMPAAWRAALQRRLTGRAAPVAGGCGGCDGCAPSAGPVSARVVVVHRAPPRAADGESATPGR